ERIVSDTGGNPLALLELPRGLSPAELALSFGLSGGEGVPQRIEQSFRRRVDALPDATQRLMLLAAADQLDDPGRLWRGALSMGLTTADADAAWEAGLLEIGERLRFTHPLVRSAVYRAATPAARREAHGALAEACDSDVEADTRAWHRSLTTPGADEE